MKVALQISGQLRRFEAYYDIYKMQLLDTLNPDIFVSTWITKKQQAINDENSIDVYKSLYQPILCQVDDFDSITNEDTKLNTILTIAENNPDLHTYRSYKNMIYMWYKRFKCNQLFKTHHHKYDVVIVTRPDLVLCEPISKEHMRLAQNHLVIPLGADFENGICDIIAFGPPHYIDAYCSLYSHMTEYIMYGVKLHAEFILKYHLNYLKIPIKRISYTTHLNYRRMT